MFKICTVFFLCFVVYTHKKDIILYITLPLYDRPFDIGYWKISQAKLVHVYRYTILHASIACSFMVDMCKISL